MILVCVDALGADLAMYEAFSFFRDKSKLTPNQTVLLMTYDAPPTVTDMRVRAFMTGNPPPFINIQRNFQV
jgi:predicted AlkP superfamily pyrophosphatase or phosphodiesterase